MEKNEEMYQFYKREYTETRSDISLNTPFTIIEGQLAKENQATIRVTVDAKGEDGLEKFSQWVKATLEGAIDDPDVAAIHGTFRKKRERFSRQLKVVGNSIAEIGYCYTTSVKDGEKKVIADNPYIRNRHWKSLIFNPSRQFDNSDIYFVEEFVTWDDLHKRGYQEIKDDEGNITKKGVYKNLDELKASLRKKEYSFEDDTDISYISGGRKIPKKNPPIRLLTRWEGTDMAVIADGTVIIRREEDPYKLGGHNLLLAVRYVVEGRPYAYGEIDAIYKPVRAQDTVMNQSIELVNKALRGSYILGPSLDIDNFMAVLDQGGAMKGDPTQVAVVPANMPPQAAFQTIDVLQQVVERVARYSPYANGVTSQASDKTKGTASGIANLQQAAEPNSESQIDDIEDMFMNPIGRGFLKMIANMMSPTDVRYSLLKGRTTEWVKASKGVLMGRATIGDMVTCGLLDEEEAQQYLSTPDPVTGAPTPIPGADKAYVFDVDWIVKVNLDNQSAADREEKSKAQMALVQMGREMGVQFDPTRTIQYFAQRQDFEELDDLLLTDQEKQAAAQNQQPTQKVSESLSYKDAPPDVQAQIEQQAGLQPSQFRAQQVEAAQQPITPPQVPATV